MGCQRWTPGYGLWPASHGGRRDVLPRTGRRRAPGTAGRHLGGSSEMASETCAKAAWRSKVPITGPAARTPAEGPQSPDARQRARRRSLGKQSSTSGASISMPCCAEAYAESGMTRASASGGERGEDAEVGVKLDLLDASDSEWRNSGLMLQAAEAPLDGRPAPIEVAEPACCRAGSCGCRREVDGFARLAPDNCVDGRATIRRTRNQPMGALPPTGSSVASR